MVKIYRVRVTLDIFQDLHILQLNLLKGYFPDLLVKLVEIAVTQQTRTRDRTFERVEDPDRPPVPAVQPPTLGPISRQLLVLYYGSPELVY